MALNCDKIAMKIMWATKKTLILKALGSRIVAMICLEATVQDTRLRAACVNKPNEPNSALRLFLLVIPLGSVVFSKEPASLL